MFYIVTNQQTDKYGRNAKKANEEMKEYVQIKIQCTGAMTNKLAVLSI